MAARFQFSIRLTLIVMAAFAGGLAAVCAEQSLQSALAIDGLTMAFTTTAIVRAMHTKGSLRTFWAGTAIMLCIASIAVSWWILPLALSIKQKTADPQTFEANRCIWWLWCAAPVNGLFAVIVHWLFTPRTTSPSATRGVGEGGKGDILL